MEKRSRAGCNGGGGDLMDRLPHSLLVEILTRLDLESLCCAAPVCRTFNVLVSQALSYITNLDLSGFKLDIRILKRILRDNKVLRTLTLDCRRLDDSSIKYFAGIHLRELVLLKCSPFSTCNLTSIGELCPNLRIFKLEMIDRHKLESSQEWKRNVSQLLKLCLYLETFWIKFQGLDLNLEDLGYIEFLPKNIEVLLLQPISEHQAKKVLLNAGACRNVTKSSIKSGNPYFLEPKGFTLRSLSLVLDRITDELLDTIVNNLHLLAELSLEDRPMEEPSWNQDLTNNGIQLLISFSHLTCLSLTRSRQYLATTFTRVNDMGVFLLAEGCKNLEHVRLGGFSRVTDAGYVSILQACKNLRKLEIVNACFLSDLSFHDLTNAPCSLVELKLISCKLLTCETARNLSMCESLEVLDLSGCKSIGDQGLISISKLFKLTALDLGGADITDAGLSALGGGRSPISTLNIRGCKRVTDRGVSSLLLGDGIIGRTLSTLDLGFMPGVTDRTIFNIAEACKELKELCLRDCFCITDASIEALGSAEGFDGKRRSLRRLDLYHCSGLSHKSYQLLCGSSFCSLHWLGVGRTSFSTRCMEGFFEVSKERPWVTICLSGCEMDCKDGWMFHYS